jgi:pimeloyl-ACP methyl ester carboxylesterase
VAEQFARIVEVEIAYEEFGDREDPAMLLIMGLGVQMLGWDAELCEMLAAEGFRVVRFDNRDVGRSSRYEGPVPDWTALAAGDGSSASYLLDDMSDDAAKLLDHLGIERVHLVGASLGGMIAQMLAIREPERVLSLTSIMSTTGDRSVGQPHPEGLTQLFEAPPNDREGLAEWAVRNWAVIGSPAYEADEERLRERARRSFDRGYNPAGTGRQLAAIIASGDRTPDLTRLSLPALVIHGEEDPLIDLSGGRATAAAIPGARLILIPGMGHDLPRQLWPSFVEEIVANARQAGAPDRHRGTAPSGTDRMSA